MEWIKTEERFPENNDDILFTDISVKDLNGNGVNPMVSFGFYQRGVFKSYIDTRDNWNPTHWMPLPKPPNSQYKQVLIADGAYLDKLKGKES